MKRYGIVVRTPYDQVGWVVLEGAVFAKASVVPTKPMEIGKKKEATQMNKKQVQNYLSKLQGFPLAKRKRIKGGRNARSSQN